MNRARHDVRVLAALGLVAAVHVPAGAAAAAGGTLIVKTEPDGAQVFLNGEVTSRGTTPLVLADISRGRYTVRVELEGYEGKSGEAVVAPGGYRVLELRLPPTGRRGLEDLPADAPAAKRKPVGAASRDAPRGGGIGPAEGPGSKADAVPKYVDVTCPACTGSGLVKETGCVTCRARGYVGINRCGKCNSSGRAEYSCAYCKGKGRLVVGAREGACRACAGKGHPPCLACKRKGTIRRYNPEAAAYPTADCPACDGGGFVPKARCTVCAGKGQIRVGSLVLYGMGAGGFGGGVTDGQTRMVGCPFCGADGECQPICRECHGRGYKGSARNPVPCPSCYGVGHAFIPCRSCRGQGWVRARK